jgi:hypothetical protein
MSHESAMEGRKKELTRTRDGGLEGTRWTGDGRVLAASVPAAAQASALVPAGEGREGKLTNGKMGDRLI